MLQINTILPLIQCIANILLFHTGGVTMENTQRVCELHSRFWFSFTSQSYFFSVGSFAFPKTTEYKTNVLQDLIFDRIAMENLS